MKGSEKPRKLAKKKARTSFKERRAGKRAATARVDPICWRRWGRSLCFSGRFGFVAARSWRCRTEHVVRLACFERRGSGRCVRGVGCVNRGGVPKLGSAEALC